MLPGYVRPVAAPRRTSWKTELCAPSGAPAACLGPRRISRFRAPFGFLLLSLLFAPFALAAGQPGAQQLDRPLWLVAAAHPSGVHPAWYDADSRSRSLIQQVRFNGKVLSIERGVVAGPGKGDLEIQFTPLGASDHLLYRLLGSDNAWKEAGKDGLVSYSRLEPGRYELDFQLAESGSSRASIVESIPIVVVPVYWQTGWFRGLCILCLLLLVLALHRLRVKGLARHVQKLQERVSQTKAELTLATKTAADAEVALKEQALRDSLTGLWNRRAILSMLEKEMCRAQRDRFPITLVMIDLDHFKRINDTFGHLTGDDVLREAAGRLVDAMRPYDMAGRYGGEEFLIVLPSCSPQNGVQRAEYFRRAIAGKPMPTGSGPLAVTCSLGVAAYDGSMSPEDLIHLADEALYHAKRMGRNCVCVGNQKAVAGRRAGA